MSYTGMRVLLIRPVICATYHSDLVARHLAWRFFGRDTMLKYAIIFAIISLIAGALGFGGIAAGSAGIAKILFGLFLILAVVFVVLAALGVGAVRKVLK